MDTIALLGVITGLGSAAVGGVYLAFWAMVMPALRRLDAGAATSAMQAINIRAERGPFIILFVVTTLAAVALGVMTLVQQGSWPEASAPLVTPIYLVAAAGLSLLSSIVTVVGNVPLNNRLAHEGFGFWTTYDRRWSRLNAIRALFALGATAVLLAATV